jgi:hypothetical protein
MKARLTRRRVPKMKKRRLKNRRLKNQRSSSSTKSLESPWTISSLEERRRPRFKQEILRASRVLRSLKSRVKRPIKLLFNKTPTSRVLLPSLLTQLLLNSLDSLLFKIEMTKVEEEAEEAEEEEVVTTEEEEVVTTRREEEDKTQDNLLERPKKISHLYEEVRICPDTKEMSDLICNLVEQS